MEDMEESVADTSYQLFHVLRFSANYGMLDKAEIHAQFVLCGAYHAKGGTLCVELFAPRLSGMFSVNPRYSASKSHAACRKRLRHLYKLDDFMDFPLVQCFVLLFIVPHIIDIHAIAAANTRMRLRCGNEQIIVFAQGKAYRE